MVHEVEDFYGVYLLLCLNPKFKGRTYIGYTVDPSRRIKQHNTGSHAGGAHRTSGRGPWEMVLIIHGFPNNISGLRFEWAWQKPHKFNALKGAPVAKRSSETAFQHRWRTVCLMLRCPPWNRLALNVRWLQQDRSLDFPPGLPPPSHMPVVFGPVRSKKIQGSPRKTKSSNQLCSPAKPSSSSPSKPSTTTTTTTTTPVSPSSPDLTADEWTIPTVVKKIALCSVCRQKIQADDSHRLTCLWPDCVAASHMRCLAQRFLGNDPDHLVPVEGRCPGCRRSVLWGDVVRHWKGCYQGLNEASQTSSDDSHWADDFHS